MLDFFCCLVRNFERLLGPLILANNCPRDNAPGSCALKQTSFTRFPLPFSRHRSDGKFATAIASLTSYRTATSTDRNPVRVVTLLFGCTKVKKSRNWHDRKYWPLRMMAETAWVIEVCRKLKESILLSGSRFWESPGDVCTRLNFIKL